LGDHARPINRSNNVINTIIGMAIATYGLRLSGFALSTSPLPSLLARSLRFVPPSVFAALIALSLSAHPGQAGARSIAALGAGMALWYLPKPWVGLLVGMGLLWLLRATAG
jgi:branched-subunit amino acid transport protein